MLAAVVVLVTAPAATSMSDIFHSQAITLERPRTGENLVVRVRVIRISIVMDGAIKSRVSKCKVVLVAIPRTGEDLVVRI